MNHSKPRRHTNVSKNNISLENSYSNLELEVQLEYLKQVIRGLKADNKKKDHKVRVLLNENIELKRQLKDKDKFIESLSKEKIDIKLSKESNSKKQSDITVDPVIQNDELHYFIVSALDKITEPKSFKDMDDSTKTSK